MESLTHIWPEVPGMEPLWGLPRSGPGSPLGGFPVVRSQFVLRLLTRKMGLWMGCCGDSGVRKAGAWMRGWMVTRWQLWEALVLASFPAPCLPQRDRLSSFQDRQAPCGKTRLCL